MVSIVKQRQDPLRERYRSAADEARIIDRARTVDVRTDPFHGTVAPGDRHSIRWRFGIHKAAGGYHDQPNPGDMLCAALASCLDSTIRMVADRLHIGIRSLEVEVTAEVDNRGALVGDHTVPVGFQGMECRGRLQAADATEPAKLQMLLAAAEHSCVVLQTLRKGLPVKAHVAEPVGEAAA